MVFDKMMINIFRLFISVLSFFVFFSTLAYAVFLCDWSGSLVKIVINTIIIIFFIAVSIAIFCFSEKFRSRSQLDLIFLKTQRNMKNITAIKIAFPKIKPNEQVLKLPVLTIKHSDCINRYIAYIPMIMNMINIAFARFFFILKISCFLFKCKKHN